MSQKVHALKDKDNRWVKYLELSEELWKKIVQETFFGILKMLECAERLLESEGHEAVCAGLYTFAVEEYGKVLLLKQYTLENGKVKIRYRDEFRNHNRKFETAIRVLPKECVNLCRTGFEKGFEDGFEHKNILADFEARLAIFYADFADSGEAIKPLPPVEEILLRKAIDKFRNIVEEIET